MMYTISSRSPFRSSTCTGTDQTHIFTLHAMYLRLETMLLPWDLACLMMTYSQTSKKSRDTLI